MVKHTRLILRIDTLYIVERSDEPVEIQLPVTYRNVSEYISYISEFYLYAVSVTQNIIHLNTCKSYVPCVYRQLCHVKIIERTAVAQFL